ncbi:glutaminase kidney isoform, mitochondrial-like [Oppia nitens]|uniref:glutaminase kidney isoform, mitochondrial-like n=1 Tax=Oppia nitens TaxID=1686743 RepID=UPI0023DBFFF4|nr:glutaminase kidney isoform, mitochondrial-like [Oppia nitens]
MNIKLQPIYRNSVNSNANSVFKNDFNFFNCRYFQSGYYSLCPQNFIRDNKNLVNDENLGKVVEKDQLFDYLFNLFQDPQTKELNVGKFLSALAEKGIKKTDPRLEKMVDRLKAILAERKGSGNIEGLTLDKNLCKTVIQENIILFSRAFKHDFVIPDFSDFCKSIEEIYWKCKANIGGKVADYIPQLAKFNPEYWGISICTIDGQRFSIGDTNIPFTIQSSGKPINYAIALNELTSHVVHQYVGQEPSGRMFNELVLDHNRKPHNPMVNAGAIVICSLLMHLIKPEMRPSEKFDWISAYYKALCGGEYLGFNNATFLSEREAADRNFAIAYYMKENKCFPEKAVLKDIMDFYFQMCSLEVNCQSLSVMGATLANGGICPISNERIITNSPVRDTLSLMHSCGMYDYSGQFAFAVGLPTKSGVSGSMMVVVPNVMGICCWSPSLDAYGNSVRGVQFCDELVSIFNFHHYDNLFHSESHKKDPRKRGFYTKIIDH